MNTENTEGHRGHREKQPARCKKQKAGRVTGLFSLYIYYLKLGRVFIQAERKKLNGVGRSGTC